MNTIKQMLFSVFLMLHTSVFSQATWQWAKQDSLNVGLAGKVEITSVHANTNALFTGYFADSTQFDGIKLVAEYPHWGNNIQGFVAKVNDNGQYAWIKKTIHSSANSWSMILKAVESNNYKTYLIGQFTNTIQLDTFTLSQPNSKGIFIAELDSAGNVNWAKNIATIHNNANGFVSKSLYDFEYDNKNQLIYFCGSFQDSISIGNTKYYTNSNYGTQEAYVACFNSAGNFKWLNHTQSKHINWLYSTNFLYGIESDLLGNTYVCGGFNADTTTISNTTFVLKRPTNNSKFDDYNGFIMQLDTAGNFTWHKQTYYRTWFEDLKKINNKQAIYAVGKIVDDTTYFDNQALKPVLNKHPGLLYTGDYAYLTKVNSSNGNFVWAKQIQDLKMRRDQYLKIVIDKFQNPIISGNCDSGFTWQLAVIPDPIAGQANFLVSTDTMGNGTWGMLVEGNYYEGNQYVSNNRYGEVVVGGSYYSDSISIANRILDIQGSIYIAKTGVVTSIQNGVDSEVRIYIYPNPSGNIITIKTLRREAKSTVAKIYNFNGVIIKTIPITEDETKVEITELAAGMYFLEINSNGSKELKKIVKN